MPDIVEQLAYCDTYITQEAVLICRCNNNQALTMQKWYQALNMQHGQTVWAIKELHHKYFIATPAQFRALSFFNVYNEKLSRPEYYSEIQPNSP